MKQKLSMQITMCAQRYRCPQMPPDIHRMPDLEAGELTMDVQRCASEVSPTLSRIPSDPSNSGSAFYSENDQLPVAFSKDVIMERHSLTRETGRSDVETESGPVGIYQDFNRRLSLDEIDVKNYTETYFDRMNGIELDTMKDARDSLFPLDKRWPFLLRVPTSIFGMPMGIGSQSILWKELATYQSMRFLHVPPQVGTVIWFIGIVVLLITSSLYILKLCFWPKAVYREFMHPVRSNFFLGPFIAALHLLHGTPMFADSGGRTYKVVGAFVFSVPMVLIEVHFYGDWLMGGHHRQLSAIANPTTQISVIGNFIGATAFASAGWKDLGMFLFSAGLLHQLVVFTTIYMRLPSSKPLSSQLHPVLFFFVAPPAAAAIAWNLITSGVDDFSKILMFISLFLYLLLVSRANLLLRGVRFSLAWWAYTFPMSVAASAAMAYTNSGDTHHVFPRVLAVTLIVVSTATIILVFVFTIVRSLSGHVFPNDEVVAVSLTPDPTVRNAVTQNYTTLVHNSKVVSVEK